MPPFSVTAVMMYEWAERQTKGWPGMALKTKPFDTAKYLDSAEDHAELLADAMATGHKGYIIAALGTIARAYGMSSETA